MVEEVRGEVLDAFLAGFLHGLVDDGQVLADEGAAVVGKEELAEPVLVAVEVADDEDTEPEPEDHEDLLAPHVDQQHALHRVLVHVLQLPHAEVAQRLAREDVHVERLDAVQRHPAEQGPAPQSEVCLMRVAEKGEGRHAHPDGQEAGEEEEPGLVGPQLAPQQKEPEGCGGFLHRLPDCVARSATSCAPLQVELHLEGDVLAAHLVVALSVDGQLNCLANVQPFISLDKITTIIIIIGRSSSSSPASPSPSSSSLSSSSSSYSSSSSTTTTTTTIKITSQGNNIEAILTRKIV